MYGFKLDIIIFCTASDVLPASLILHRLDSMSSHKTVKVIAHLGFPMHSGTSAIIL